MKQRQYAVPEAESLPCGYEDSILVTSGWDGYHEGGGGYYGDGDLNFNDYDY